MYPCARGFDTRPAPRRTGVAAPEVRGTASGMLLEGRQLLITGVLTEGSIAFAVARRAQEEGAQIVLTGFGRGMRITTRIANRLPDPPDVLELDVNDPDHIAAIVAELDERWGRARRDPPRDRLRARRRARRRVPRPRRASARPAFLTSAFSLKALVAPFADLLERGEPGSIVGLDFDAHGRVARLRLDGRREGRAGVRQPLPRARPRRRAACARTSSPPARSRRSRPAASPASTSSPAPGTPGPARLGRRRRRPGRRRLPVPAVSLARASPARSLHVDGGYHALGAPVAPVVAAAQDDADAASAAADDGSTPDATATDAATSSGRE